MYVPNQSQLAPKITKYSRCKNLKRMLFTEFMSFNAPKDIQRHGIPAGGAGTRNPAILGPNLTLTNEFSVHGIVLLSILGP